VRHSKAGSPPSLDSCANDVHSDADPKCLVQARALLKKGYWPVAIYPRGVTIQTRDGPKPATGKEPIGRAWGLERWTEERFREAFARNPSAGVGICFGPGRAPGGGWLIDLEGDGPQAAESLKALLGGEEIDTPSWDATRGGHIIFTADERLPGLMAAAKAKEGKGPGKVGVYTLPEFPGLESRIGGYKADGTTVKQVQSVVPPTPGTDGQPRGWTVQPRVAVAPLPEAAYTALEQVAAKKAFP